MTEDEARAIAAPIAKRWGVLFYTDTHMIEYESGDVLPIVDSEDVWCALMRAHGRVVELEARVIELELAYDLIRDYAGAPSRNPES